MLVLRLCESGSLDHRRADEKELHTRADAARGAEVWSQDEDTKQTLYKWKRRLAGHEDRGADTIATVGRREQETQPPGQADR